MNLAVTLLESDSEIRRRILDALREDISKTFSKAANKLINPIKNLLIEALKEEPEYNSLKSGLLKYHFGIPDSSVVDDLVVKMANTLTFQNYPIKISNVGLSGGFSLTAIRSEDISGLLNDPSAIMTDSERGYGLPWLEWLLLRNNEVIIRNYDVQLGPNPNSRTGQAIMVESNKSWRVPAEFAGSQNNNWTTRAVDRLENSIVKLIQEAIETSI